MIKPTIGRMVLFNDGASDQRVPAQICYVHSDTCINIGGFDQGGMPFSRTGVDLIQDDEACHIGAAEWMDYQKSQAEKTEELENKLNCGSGDECCGDADQSSKPEVATA